MGDSHASPSPSSASLSLGPCSPNCPFVASVVIPPPSPRLLSGCCVLLPRSPPTPGRPSCCPSATVMCRACGWWSVARRHSSLHLWCSQHLQHTWRQVRTSYFLILSYFCFLILIISHGSVRMWLGTPPPPHPILTLSAPVVLEALVTHLAAGELVGYCFIYKSRWRINIIICTMGESQCMFACLSMHIRMHMPTRVCHTCLTKPPPAFLHCAREQEEAWLGGGDSSLSSACACAWLWAWPMPATGRQLMSVHLRLPQNACTHMYFLHPLCLHTVIAVVLRNVPQPCWCYVCAAQAVPVVAVRNTFIKSFLCAAVHQVTAFLVLLAAV